MRISIRSRFLMAVLLLTGLALASIGCININVPRGAVGGERSVEKIDKDQAVSIAKRHVKDEGLNPDKFKIQTKEADDAWWVMFDRKDDGREFGWPDHFVVRVICGPESRIFCSR